MKVLFVGEGKHDVGQSDFFATEPTSADGFICRLAKKVVPHIAADSAAIAERELQRLDPDRPKGIEFLVRSAVLIAQKRGFQATVIVKDLGGQASVADELQNAAVECAKGTHRVVTGVAIESIEAWVLGARTGLRSVLGVTDQQLDAKYKLKDVEVFSPTSGKPEKRSKEVLETVAEKFGAKPHTGFREQVADAADVDELERNCPRGFKPFADQLRDKLKR